MKKTEVAGFCLFAVLRVALAADSERSGAGFPDDAKVFTVGTNGDCETIAEALAAVRKAKGAREIVLANGVCRIDKTLELDKRDTGLVIRAAEPGKAIISGSIPVTGWRKAEGTPWLCADIPQAKEGFFFRSLIVGGEPALRSEFPGGGKQLQNTNEWKVRWLSSVGNGWERPPTHDEYTLMHVKKGDLPDGMDFTSADMRVYHEWDNSLVRVESYDTEGLVVRFAEECRFPPGSFKRHGYKVYNVKEGMQKPGQWYFDCREGRLYYWPKPGEEEAMPSAEAPRTETLLRFKDADGLKIEGVVFENAKPPMMRASFGGAGIDAAVMGQGGTNVVFANVTFRNNGGLGLILQRQKGFRLVDSLFEKNGSCSVQIGGAGGEIRGNRFLQSGQIFTSACAVYLGGREIVFAENEIAGAPYCGVCYNGSRHLFESNRVSRVMQSLHDGGAFYGMSAASVVFRGNRVTDNQPDASSRHAFYYDEGSRDGLVADNCVEGGFKEVVHNHMTRNIVISNNVFKTPGDMSVSFQRSRDGVFVANELHIGGKIARLPDATSLAKWEGNSIYVQGTLTNAVPVVKRLGRQPGPVKVSRAAKTPVFDGFFDAACWPGTWHTANRGRNREDEGGAPHLFRSCHDGTNLYFAVRIARFNHEEWRTNRAEGADSVVLRFPGLEVKGWADGSSENAAAFFGGRELERQRGFGKNVFFAFKIPFERIFPAGEVPSTLSFNCEITDAQYGERRYWDSPAFGELAGSLAFEDLPPPPPFVAD